MPREHYWDFSEWVHTHSQWQNASLCGQHERDGGVNAVDDELRCVVEALFSVLPYLNWQATSAAIWLNSHTPLLEEESWQEDVWELLEATSAPYPPRREMLYNLVSSMKARTDWIPFWNVVVWGGETLRVSGVATGEVRKKQKGSVSIQ